MLQSFVWVKPRIILPLLFRDRFGIVDRKVILRIVVLQFRALIDKLEFCWLETTVSDGADRLELLVAGGEKEHNMNGECQRVLQQCDQAGLRKHSV